MIIRKTTKDDLRFLDAIFDTCRNYMAKEGNPTQWDQNYPTSKDVARDVETGEGFVCVDDQTNEVLGSFAVSTHESEYDRLYDGKWSSRDPYVVIHRMAAIPNHGAGQFIFDHLLKTYPYIRIDTHADNQTMIHILQKVGFRYCGKVSYEGYGERVAFDYKKSEDTRF